MKGLAYSVDFATILAAHESTPDLRTSFGRTI